MTEPATKQAEIVEKFSKCSDWDERYKLIIQFGKSLPEFPEEHRSEKNKVKGCQSQVWMHASYQNGIIHYDVDSDAMIVRGLIALLLDIYNDQPPSVIIQSEPTFLEELGLKDNLSMQRNNGLMAMIKQMKLYAYALQMRQQ